MKEKVKYFLFGMATQVAWYIIFVPVVEFFNVNQMVSSDHSMTFRSDTQIGGILAVAATIACGYMLTKKDWTLARMFGLGLLAAVLIMSLLGAQFGLIFVRGVF